MHGLIQEISDTLVGQLQGRQWAKDIFWDILSFDRVVSAVPFEVLPKKDRAGIEESILWAQFDDIRVVFFKRSVDAWSDEQLDAVASKIGLIWRRALLLFADASERQWQLVVCTPRSEGQAGLCRAFEMSRLSRDSSLIVLLAGLSPESGGPASKAMQALWLRGRPMEDVVSRMVFQLPRAIRSTLEQSGFLDFIRSAALHPLLRAEEEWELGRRIQLGDRDAWRQLVEHNIRLGFWGASRLRRPGVQFEESFQHSMMGIMRAADKYDPDKGTRFSTYAFTWMRQVCQREYENNASVVRLPIHRVRPTRDYLKRRRRQSRHLWSWTQEDWEFDRLARLLKPDPYDWSRSSVYQEACVALDPSVTVQINHDTDVRLNAVKSILNDFSARDRDMLYRRFGFYSDHIQTLQEIGEIHNVTREAVRQVERRMLARLRDVFPKRHPRVAAELAEEGDRKSEEIESMVSDTQAMILRLLQENPVGVSAVSLSTSIQQPSSGRRTAIRNLLEVGRIELVGIGRAARYRLSESFD